ncbi:MAG: LysM peptidoglycan-binding domain-containing protein [Planctomycetota bacterium]|jgi:hypothetical protein|nr:LysM peptidoglycan-binding domain-containing protein [Planctomycetota bacterium]
MAHAHTENEEEGETMPERRRPLGPRFGPFVTIAAAILLLFGAASRWGKTSVDAGWLNLDFLASSSLERESARRQEQRNATLITLGAIPAPLETNSPPRGLQLSENVLPPERNVDFYAYQENRRQYESPAPLSMAAPTEGNHHPGASEAAPRFDPAPEAKPQVSSESRGGAYVVAQGDNWVKIGKHLGKRWQDIQKANPQANGGLRVGMKLVIP